MGIIRLIVALALLGERIWKHWMVIRFFQPPLPTATTVPSQISILQPILSGDPTLSESLEQNLFIQDHSRVEYLWLVDTDDREGQQICRDLIARYPKHTIQLLLFPPPPARVNPKMFKLIEGARIARGEIICVLDDDTRLPEDGLTQCLPYLDQPGVGLAFGLPYYVNFSNVWSQLVAYFVNSNSLLTYIPYTTLSQPFTINGMFYALKRTVFDEIGGFTGIEQILADDFAIAQRVRFHGYQLAQTPVRHGISTQVHGLRPYFHLIQRWFIFPRESLLRHLSWQEQFVLYGLALLPAFIPLFLVLALLVRPSQQLLGYTCLYFGYNFALFVHLNHRYLHSASPLRTAWWVPIIQLVFPVQLLIALCSPQRIVWRGHVMQVEKGGSFQFVRRQAPSL